MGSTTSIWKKFRRNIKAVLFKNKRKAYSKDKKRVLRGIISSKHGDLNIRLDRLYRAYERNLITGKQFRKAAKLIIDSYK